MLISIDHAGRVFLPRTKLRHQQFPVAYVLVLDTVFFAIALDNWFYSRIESRINTGKQVVLDMIVKIAKQPLEQFAA